MTHPIFQKELDALEHEFDPQNNNGLSCEDYERVKSFLLASLQRASMAVVEEVVLEDMQMIDKEIERLKKRNDKGDRDRIFAHVGDYAMLKHTLATAQTIVGEEETRRQKIEKGAKDFAERFENVMEDLSK